MYLESSEKLIGIKNENMLIQLPETARDLKQLVLIFQELFIELLMYED